jgi:hypothetical protein
VQILGLVGARGILPVSLFLSSVYGEYGARAYWFFPTLLWASGADAVLSLLCWGGAVLALLLVAGRASVPVLAVLWMFYLSLTVAGQVFLQFQWDSLLLETGLLACLYAPLRAARYGSGQAGAEPNAVVRWVLGSLAFKLTFLSGITKILSGDPSWAAWTAMTYHYETQPIPAWTSWYAHHLPAIVHYWSVPATLAIELVAPFALLLPARFRRTRVMACIAMILLQLNIAVTGNYGFFNLLTIVLYLAALDDATLSRIARFWGEPFRLAATRRRIRATDTSNTAHAERVDPAAWRLGTTAAAIIVGVLSLAAFIREMELTSRASTRIVGPWTSAALQWVAPFRAVNGYGLFRVMTTERPEIVLEVSADGQNWQEYEFRWKVGHPMRRPQFVEPHMPRLDWQMWFAALDPPSAQYWLERLIQRILAGEPSVVRLLGPSPLTEPPRFVRLAYYDYRLTTRDERAETGAWWRRTFIAYLTEPIGAPP